MKKNNKGFTLVELLAALVILGVLSLVAMPTVVNMLGNSRDKLYVTDAKKLISQAEYKFRVASSEIEKPDDGECLLLSMVYLDNSDFDNPPNNGEYVREASYVVIKNNGGDYEYSVELVEEVKKNVYKGVELSRDSTLNTNSTRHVVAFDKEDLYFVENNTVMGKYNGKQVDTSYINSKLGGSYVTGISKVYNYPDLAESTYNANYAIPKIVRAEYVSASNKNFNSLDAILKVVATDVDTPTKDLVVYVGSGREGRYPSLTAPDCDPNESYNFTECKYQYGSLSDFSLKVDFSSDNYDYSGETASLYIMVVDPEGNADRINPSYKIHTNEAPIIDKSKSGVFKRNSDSINLSTAVLRLYVSDDSTPSGDLEYCLTENKDATTCVGYKKYSDFINSEINYTFECGSDCVYDGRGLTLKVFLRDTDPTTVLETSEVFTYNLFKNDVPQITNLELISEQLPFVTGSSKALKADVKLTVNDSSSSNNLFVTLDEDAGFNKNPTTYTYAEFSNNVSYTFSGLYDGEERVLHVKVVDEYGTVATSYVNYGNVHRNAAPVIDEVIATSMSLVDNVCPNSKICDKYENNGGAYKVSIDISASDDLVSEEDLMLCVSTVASDCTSSNLSNFLPYSSLKSSSLIIVPTASTKIFNGDTYNIYVAAYDGYGVGSTYNYSQVSAPDITEYKIYKNQPPEIDKSELAIVSNNIDYNFKDVKVNFKVNDDLDNVNTLTYKIYDNAGGAVKTGTITASTADALNEIAYTFGGNYDGNSRTLTIEVTDSYNETSKITKEYEIHKNNAPTISYVTIESTDKPCTEEACENGNSINTKIKFNVNDDLDTSMKDLLLCVSETSGDCTDYKAIKNHAGFDDSNGEFSITHVIGADSSLPYKGETKTVYLYVKDSYGEVGGKSGSYTLYNNTKALIDSAYPVVRSSNYEEVEVEIEDGDTYVTNKNPNISTINFSVKATDEFVEPKNLKYQICYVTSITADVTDSSQVTCLENNKFYDYGTSTVSTKAVDLGVTAYEGQEFFLFAKVYDNYAYACATDSSKCNQNDDYISYSSMVYYQVYQDVDPEVTKFTVSRVGNSLSYETLNITLAVYDKLDTFSYCISESDTECTNYSTSYSGDTGSDITTTYSPSWGDVTNLDEDRSFILYLHVKDGHGKKIYVSTLPDRVPCDAIIDENDNIIDEGTVQESILYELKSGSTELTATTCGYKCYYWEQAEVNGEIVGPSDTANFVAYYKRTVTFLDKDDRSIVCSKDVDENYAAHCNFKSCYYNSTAKNYKVTAIGYISHDNSDSSYVHSTGTTSHVPTYYRNEYITDYDDITDSIILHPTGNKICGKCFDEGVYNKTVITYDNNLG